MDKTKIFIIVFSLIISLLLLIAIIFSIVDLPKINKVEDNINEMVRKNSKTETVRKNSKTETVRKNSKTETVRKNANSELEENIEENIDEDYKSYIPQKVYIVHEKNQHKYARTIKFNDPTLQTMNVLDIGGIIEPFKDDKSYGLAVLHEDDKGNNKLAIISRYNSCNSNYRNINLVDNSNMKIFNMKQLTNVNTILFGLANGQVYYFNPIQDHWISTNIKGINHISGTSIDTNILLDNTLYDVVIKNGTVSLENPKMIDIPSGFRRIYGPNKDIFADINNKGDIVINLLGEKTIKKDIADISFVFDNKSVGTLIVQKDDKNFMKGKYLLGDHLLIGKRILRTKDIQDPSDISVKLT
jgi:hypothetical protein